MLATEKRETPSARGKRPGTRDEATCARPSAQPASAATQEQIRTAAYYLFVKRGRQPGHDLSDWLEAERITQRKQC